MKCPKCGLTVRDGSRLCPNCGEWLGEVDGRTRRSPACAANDAFAANDTFAANDVFPANDRTIVIPPPTAAPAPQAVPRQPPAPTQPAQPRPQHAPPPPQPAVGMWPAPNVSDRVERPAPPGSEPQLRPVADGGFEEVTTLSVRRSKLQYWTLTLPSGVVELVSDRVIIGRAPEFSPESPTARLIHVEDPTRSVSKNHAVFSVKNGSLVVEDLGSTNGVVVTRSDGQEVDVRVGESIGLDAGAKVELGDVVLFVGRA